MVSNKKNGNAFEQQLCELLSKEGFWATRLTQNSQGQPFDVIAARNGEVYAIDCKDCRNDEFPFSRIEENQHTAMELWKETGNGFGWFALRFSDGTIRMVSMADIQLQIQLGKHEMNLKQLKVFTLPFEDWVMRW